MGRHLGQMPHRNEGRHLADKVAPELDAAPIHENFPGITLAKLTIGDVI